LQQFKLIALLFAVFVGIPIGIGLLLYFIPKKLGFQKTAKYLTIVYGAIVLSCVCYIAFEDQFFTKQEARMLVEEQGFKLADEFDLVKNESMSGIGDYYHTFTLRLSERDRQDAILRITSAENFALSGATVKDPRPGLNRYFGPTVSQNYQNHESYVREYFKPSGRKGYAPTFRRISVSKTANKLIFEDIDE
jgi:hypothetical protein